MGKIQSMNKKGSLIDLIYLAIALVFFGVVVLVGLKMGSSINTQIDSLAITDDTTDAMTDKVVNNYESSINNAFLYFVIFLAMVTLILAALVRVHPIFIPFYFIGLTIVIVLSGILSNIYQAMAQDSNLIGTASNLTFITYILTYLPLIIAVFGIFLMVVMYKTWSINQ